MHQCLAPLQEFHIQPLLLASLTDEASITMDLAVLVLVVFAGRVRYGIGYGRETKWDPIEFTKNRDNLTSFTSLMGSAYALSMHSSLDPDEHVVPRGPSRFQTRLPLPFGSHLELR